MGGILGLGLDLVEQARIRTALARHGERFVQRFTEPAELRPRSGPARIAHLSGLFAAKEAVLKALGTGWAQGLDFRQVVVQPDASGAPQVSLRGEALRRAAALGVTRVRLSITHDGGVAAAVAVLEGPEPPLPSPGARTPDVD